MVLTTIDAAHIASFLDENKESFALHYIKNGSSQEQADVARADLEHYAYGGMEELNGWPCQDLHGGTGSAIYNNIDGMCQHPECHPHNDDRSLHMSNHVLYSDRAKRRPVG